MHNTYLGHFNPFKSIVFLLDRYGENMNRTLKVIIGTTIASHFSCHGASRASARLFPHLRVAPAAIFGVMSLPWMTEKRVQAFGTRLDSSSSDAEKLHIETRRREPVTFRHELGLPPAQMERGSVSVPFQLEIMGTERSNGDCKTTSTYEVHALGYAHGWIPGLSCMQSLWTNPGYLPSGRIHVPSQCTEFAIRGNHAFFFEPSPKAEAKVFVYDLVSCRKSTEIPLPSYPKLKVEDQRVKGELSRFTLLTPEGQFHYRLTEDLNVIKFAWDHHEEPVHVDKATGQTLTQNGLNFCLYGNRGTKKIADLSANSFLVTQNYYIFTRERNLVVFDKKGEVYQNICTGSCEVSYAYEHDGQLQLITANPKDKISLYSVNRDTSLQHATDFSCPQDRGVGFTFHYDGKNLWHIYSRNKGYKYVRKLSPNDGTCINSWDIEDSLAPYFDQGEFTAR